MDYIKLINKNLKKLNLEFIVVKENYQHYSGMLKDLITGKAKKYQLQKGLTYNERKNFYWLCDDYRKTCMND